MPQPRATRCGAGNRRSAAEFIEQGARLGARVAGIGPAAHAREDSVEGILKFFGSVIGIIFLIGLIVVVGLLMLIF